MKYRIITVLFLLIGIAPSVNALSCAPLKELFIAQCSNFTCEESFYIKEVSGYLSCARRPVVEFTPSWAKGALEYELKKSQQSGHGVYELEINRNYWSNDTELKDVEDYIRMTTDDKISMSFIPRVSANERRNIASIREEWYAKEKSEYVVNLIWEAVDWLSLLVFLVFVGYSVKWFRSWAFGCIGRKWLVISICIQFLIFIIANLSVNSWSNFLIGFFFLLLPLIWLYEVIYLVYIKLCTKNTKKN